MTAIVGDQPLGADGLPEPPVGTSVPRPNVIDLRRESRTVRARPRGPVPMRGWFLFLLADSLGLASPAVQLRHGRVALAAFVLLSVMFHTAFGEYKPRLHLSVLADLPRLAAREGLAVLMVAAFLSWTHFPPGLSLFFRDAAIALAVQSVLRGGAYAIVRWARGRGRFSHSTLIIGGGQVARDLERVLDETPGYGLHVKGIIDDDMPRLIFARGNVSEQLTALPTVLERDSIDVVIVAFGLQSEDRVAAALRTIGNRSCQIFVVPRLYEVHSLAGHADHIGAIPVVRIRRTTEVSPARRIKRVFDIVSSLAAILVLAPVLVAVAAAVRWEGGPGVIFRQIRVGRDGREFELYKFRSMRPVDENESATQWSIAQDHRVGPVGKILRRTSLDELPQFWNVLRGDMSIVGPRPERPHFVSDFGGRIPEYTHRHRVQCGLTGLAQISGLRGDTSIADRARHDNYYIENWSLWLDLRIMFLTVSEVFFAGGR